MRHMFTTWLAIQIALVILLPAPRAQAQMNTVFDSIFNGILIDQMSVSPGEHKNHFIPAAEAASQTLSPALEQMIVRNIGSLPLSSSIAGTIWQKAPDGTPRKLRTSWGPIFAETGTTLGKGGLSFGVNYTSSSLDRLRGLDTRDISFTFTHENVFPDDGPLGTLPMERDLINVVMDLNIDADVFALTGTYGLLPNLDVGVAVPFVKLRMYGDAQATVSSFTFAQTGNALHFFSGTSTDPIFTTTQPYDESATGIGDIALRAKYAIGSSSKEQYALLLDARLPTGAEADFLGSGSTNVNLVGVASRSFDRFTPHVNLGYGYRGAEGVSDDFVFATGFDQSVSSSMSFAFDVLGVVPLNTNETVSIAPGTTAILDRPADATHTAVFRDIKNSNVPDYKRDTVVDASFGMRVAAFDRSILQANMTLPMNKGGLRSGIAWTLGLAIYN